MKVVIGADHAGFALKEKILAHKFQDTQFIDIGTFNESPCDYPDIAVLVCEKIISQEAARGIVICGSGIGANIAANKIKGIRSSVCHDTYSAAQGVAHDDLNVLALGARVIGESLAFDLVAAFLKAKFSNEDRHKRRVQKIIKLEDR